MNSSNFYFPLSGLINTITSIVLGVFVLSQNKSDIKYKTFAFFCLCTTVWSGFYFAWLIADTGSKALLYCHAFMAAAILIPSAYLHYILALVRLNVRKRKLIVASYIVAIIFSVFNFTPYFILDTQPRLSFKYWPTAGPLFLVFLILWGTIAIYGVYEIMKAYRNAAGAERDSMRYVLIGSVIGWIGGGSNYLLWYDIPVFPFLNITISIYMIMIAYAIVRHQLMDIEVAIKKTLVYSILISLISISFFIIVYLLERAFSIVIGYGSVLLTVIILTIFSLIFIPLKNKIQRSIDKYFFKGTIDQIEKEKELLSAELERSERLKAVSTLAAGMAHEIKNPLTSIKTFVEHVYEKENDAKFKAKFMSIVPREIDKIASLIDQLLNYSRVERINMKTHNIHNLLDYVSDLYSNVFLNKHITLRKRYGAQLSDITCDENQLKQAFINIVLNSIEAMPNGGEIDIQTQNIGSAIEISIKDNGAGIPKDKIAHLFEPFYTTKDKGTGLGLFIVHQIIGNNKGSIVIHSGANDGTTVNITFKTG